MISHADLVRSGCDQRMEYDPSDTRIFIQGVAEADYAQEYPKIPWKLGLFHKKESPRVP